MPSRIERPEISGRKTQIERRLKTLLLTGTALLAAFGVGLWLGRSPKLESADASAGGAGIPELFAKSSKPGSEEARYGRSAIADGKSNGRQLPVAGHRAPKRLRLRSTSSVSSSEAKAGDRLLFVTEDHIAGKSGQRIPAGSLVQGVVAEAARSTGDSPGSLVIEIRALYVGNETIPVHALPYKSFAQAGAAAEQVAARDDRDPKKMGIRTFLRVNPEAIVPRESILEFELVDIDGILPSGAEPSEAPAIPRAPIESSPLEDNLPDLSPTEPLPVTPAPKRPRARVASV